MDTTLLDLRNSSYDSQPHSLIVKYKFSNQSGVCLVPRRLSLDENVRAKEGGKETTSIPFPWSLAVHRQSLAFRACLYDEKNEAPEEEAESGVLRIVNCDIVLIR